MLRLSLMKVKISGGGGVFTLFNQFLTVSIFTYAFSFLERLTFLVCSSIIKAKNGIVVLSSGVLFRIVFTITEITLVIPDVFPDIQRKPTLLFSNPLLLFSSNKNNPKQNPYCLSSKTKEIGSVFVFFLFCIYHRLSTNFQIKYLQYE